jgi:hypothetical protein
MIARLTYRMTMIFLRVKQEVTVGIETARVQHYGLAPDGILACGVAVDDHEDGECNAESYLGMFEGDDD